MAFAIVVICAYWVMLLTTRWVFIAVPNRRATLAKVAATRSRLEVEGGQPSQRAALMSLLERAEAELKPKISWPRNVVEFIWWNGWRELVAHGLIHEAKRLSAEHRPMAHVRARLTAGLTELDELPESQRQRWDDALRAALGGAEAHSADDKREGADEVPSPEGIRATLGQFLEELYDARDTKFTNLATIQNKVTWLVMLGLVLMLALVVEDYEQLLLAGAIGGILSRLQRVLVRRNVPTDYGVSWAVLFLAPVAAALAAWAGLQAIAALQELDVIDLTGVFDAAGGELRGSPPAGVLGLAIALGFSERFLDRIVQSATESIAPSDTDAHRPGNTSG